MPAPMTTSARDAKTSPQPIDAAMEAAISGIEHEFDALVAHVRRTARANAQLVSDGMLPGAYKVLTAIARAGCITLSVLTEALMLDKGQMSRTVRELDERGLIARSPAPEDGRSILISVSEYGAERLAEVQGGQKTLLRSAMQQWSIADVERFTELLHALAHGRAPH